MDTSKYKLSDIITYDPNQRSGQPCIRGLRITVGDILGYLASGMSKESIIADFPELTLDDLHACLEFASLREKHIAHISAA